jgi:hypothetical protein
MAARKRSTSRAPAESQSDPEVAAFLSELDHPLKKEIDTVRRVILDVSPEIREGIKWNGPSFRTSEYFATIHLRSRDGVQLIFHKGAKVKDNATKSVKIPDPEGLIQWLATDRCLVTLGAGKDLAARKTALQAIVREWIRQI